MWELMNSKDLAAALAAYEEDRLGQEDTMVLFQHLVDTGLAWTLQGHYGRIAEWLIEEGLVEGEKILRPGGSDEDQQ